MTGLWLELNAFGLIYALPFLSSQFRAETYMCENPHWLQAQIQSFLKFLASKSGLNSQATQSDWWQLSCDQPGRFLLTQNGFLEQYEHLLDESDFTEKS